MIAGRASRWACPGLDRRGQRDYGDVMARLTLALAATIAAVVATAATAAAPLHWVHDAGVLCAFGTGAKGTGVACAPESGRGYKVTLGTTGVTVWAPSGRSVFHTARP